ncbi:unnamed protein product [Symbiodinium pilosum]|uniref:Uncharacterized protein n=1 Tax=Symbiodinium pilosum TaxID=2952 RepID=A0A812U0W3_SYMPI|nr:unnamed protein product [Symbiodinium pilosum]
MKPAAQRGQLRRCKLCMESVGSWSQISLMHVAAFCGYERLEEDLQLILSLKGNINARAVFDVELDYPWERRIHFAVYAGNVPGVKALLRCRAAVESRILGNAIDMMMETVIAVAVLAHLVRLPRATFDAVPDYTPLHLATALWARAGEDAVLQHQVVKVLLEHSADPTAVDLSGATCNDLRPQAKSAKEKVQQARRIGIKKGMVVATRFIVETADARRCEFVVMTDVEDPDEEDDLLQISLLPSRDGTDENRVLKIQQSCVSVLGYRFFQVCIRHLLDEGFGTPGMQSPRSLVDSPIIRSRTLDEESAVEGSLTVQDFRSGGPSKRRAVTIADLHMEEMMSDADLDLGIEPEIDLEEVVQIKLSHPLRPGKFYRKRNRVATGYLLHFAIDEMVREEDKKWRASGEEVLKYIVTSRADIHAKADVERRTNSNEYCSVTGMHIAAVGHCLPAVKTLLSLNASIESAAVFDKIPCWTPLSDAIVATIDYHNSMRHSTGQHPTVKCAKDCVIQYLLEQRANPDGCGGSGGLSCLHLAVGKNCESELVCLLVENSAVDASASLHSDVTLKTSAYVRATRAHGNRGWDRGLTPLQICDYADQVYSQKQRSEVMALLAPSLRGASFLLQDVTSMAAFSVSGANELVKRVLEESKKDSGGTAARALSTLRLRAVTGARSAEGLEPVDSIAELLEIAPTIAISVLDELLLTEPAAWPSLDCQHGTCFT